ncbi:MAG TPA: hypothetical protein VGU64_15025, partial [Terriglobales bacterium]|nr:hypothetical protein [Terriglobales bacterium]
MAKRWREKEKIAAVIHTLGYVSDKGCTNNFDWPGARSGDGGQHSASTVTAGAAITLTDTVRRWSESRACSSCRR